MNLELGSPGSIARHLSGPWGSRRFGAPFCLFAYVPRSEEPSGIRLLAACDSREAAERYLSDPHTQAVVDVRTYGCPVPDHPCRSCERLAFTWETYCGTCAYTRRTGSTASDSRA